MNSHSVRPNTRRVTLFIFKTLASQFLTHWNINASLSDSHILICWETFVYLHTMGWVKNAFYKNILQWILQWETGFQAFIQRYRIFIWFGWGIIVNSSFSCFCRFSNHRSMQQIEFFPLLRCFSFVYFFNDTFIYLLLDNLVFLTELNWSNKVFLITYVICKEYSLHYYVMEDGFLSM